MPQQLVVKQVSIFNIAMQLPLVQKLDVIVSAVKQWPLVTVLVKIASHVVL